LFYIFAEFNFAVQRFARLLFVVENRYNVRIYTFAPKRYLFSHSTLLSEIFEELKPFRPPAFGTIESR